MKLELNSYLKTPSKYKTVNIIRRLLLSYFKYPLAPKREYISLWNNEKSKIYPAVDSYLNQLNANVPKEWIHALALPTQVSIKTSGVNYQHGFVLFKTLVDYLERSQLGIINILEIGTAKGFSCLCMAKVFEDLGVKGTIRTIDILPHEIPLYWNSISDIKGKISRVDLLNAYENLTTKFIQFIHGKSQEILPQLHPERIHFAFIDGEHFYENVIFDGEFIAKRQKTGDLLVFDDYNTSLFPGVVKAADEICLKNNYSKIIINSNEQRGYLIAQKQ